MSITTASVAPVDAGEVAEKPSRKFPLPCWSQEETLALIDAYRERWYALRRGYLRTADWDAVAAAVTSRCPDASPAKTSAQCRHKMEKLRQRYRAEKQRSLTYPVGRFFSSWFFFENMDAMENGAPVSAAGSNHGPEVHDISGNGIRLKAFLDQNVLKLKLDSKNSSKLVDDSSPNFGLGHGFKAKSSLKNCEAKVGSDFGSQVFNGYTNSYMDVGSEKEDEGMDFRGGFGVKSGNDGILGAPRFKGNKFGNVFGNSRNGFDGSDGFSLKSLGDESSMPPRIRMKRTGRIDGRLIGYDMVRNDHGDSKDALWLPMGASGKYGGNMESDLHSRVLNGFYSSSNMGFENRGSGGGGASAGKRGRNSIDEMVSAIKMLGEGFMKMENMKMDMAREIEKNRMEMEMKRNEMILESQRQIVDAFAKGLLEMKSKKVKIAAAPETK